MKNGTKQYNNKFAIVCSIIAIIISICSYMQNEKHFNSTNYTKVSIENFGLICERLVENRCVSTILKGAYSDPPNNINFDFVPIQFENTGLIDTYIKRIGFVINDKQIPLINLSTIYYGNAEKMFENGESNPLLVEKQSSSSYYMNYHELNNQILYEFDKEKIKQDDILIKNDITYVKIKIYAIDGKNEYSETDYAYFALQR